MIEGTSPECFSRLAEYWLLCGLTPAAADRAPRVQIGGQTRIVVSFVAKALTPKPRGG